MGAESGDQIQVRAKLAGETEGLGYIVSQRATRKFRVSINGVEGVCSLVDKADGTLADGEMSITVTDDSSTPVRVTKLHNRLAIVAGAKTPWNFSASTTDGAVQAADPVSIEITAQPADDTTAAGAASFAVTATDADSYQWQVREGSGSYSNVVSGAEATYAGDTTATLSITGATAATDGWTYRCVVSATDAPDVTSAKATLTFGS